MSENAGLTLILTQVQNATGFTSANTSIGEWGILNKGTSDHYAIIKPGETERIPLTFTVKDNMYETIIQVWQRYKDDGDSLTSLLTHVDNITTRLDPWRKMADTTKTIRDANVIGYGQVIEQWNKDGGVSWLSREISVEWTEEEAVTYAE